MKIKNWNLILISFVCLLSTTLILYWVFKFSAFGIDFTDEGYYLNWISNPFLYKDSLSQFGYIYYPLYNLVDGNIAWVRRLNFFITFVLACTLVYLVINNLVKFDKINKVIQCVLSSGIAITSLTYVYIQTPSYNHLNFQALLITSIGIVLIDVTKFNKNVLSYIIIGVGGWLTFMAKPSSALGLSVLILMYIILSKQFQLRFLLISVATVFTLFIISAFIIDGSITAYVERYFLSVKLLTLFQGGHGVNKIFRIDELNLSNKIILSISFIFLILVYFIWLVLKNYKKNNFIYIITCFLIFVIIATLAITDINWNPNYGEYQPYQLFGVVYACLFTTIILIIKNKIIIHDVRLGLFFLFLILPYVFALGTNNNYWSQSGIVSFFWLISGFVLIIPWFLKLKLYQPVIFLVLISQLITSINIKEAIEKPYRYNQPLRLDDSRITINNKNHQLILSKEFAKYINDARKIAAQSGFTKGDAIIDLSGQSPGLLYLLGAKSIGTAWNVGGYKGSLDSLKAIFNLVDCTDIANSWVLYESKGPISISTDLLTSLGMNFPIQYQKVGSWETASEAGGYKQTRIQELYKPLNANIAKSSCELIRKKL
jgi:hypothetical protein